MVDALLKELVAALLEADVNVKLVASLRTKVKNQVSCPKQVFGLEDAEAWSANMIGEEELGRV